MTHDPRSIETRPIEAAALQRPMPWQGHRIGYRTLYKGIRPERASYAASPHVLNRILIYCVGLFRSLTLPAQNRYTSSSAYRDHDAQHGSFLDACRHTQCHSTAFCMPGLFQPIHSTSMTSRATLQCEVTDAEKGKLEQTYSIGYIPLRARNMLMTVF